MSGFQRIQSLSFCIYLTITVTEKSLHEERKLNLTCNNALQLGCHEYTLLSCFFLWSLIIVVTVK